MRRENYRARGKAMVHSSVTRMISLAERDGFAGSVAVLDARGKAGVPDAVLVAARNGASRHRVELSYSRSVWELSIPSAGPRVVLRPQIAAVGLKTGTREQSIRFRERAAIRTLGVRLRRDHIYRSSAFAFYTAAVFRMIESESAHDVHYPVLDEVIESRESFRQAVRTSGTALVLGDKHKPGKAGWVGVEVPCFVECMEKCEDDADWWEVWVHAYCLVKCGIKCGTGGGKIYPD